MAAQPKTELVATCHCGAVTVTVPYVPIEILECQCTICRRYGAAWGYWKTDEAKFDIKEGAKFVKYSWGMKTKTFDTCAECGCMCYWWPFETKESDGSAALFGLNTRMMNPMDLLYMDRKIENSWILHPIKDGAAAHRDDQAKY